MIRNLTLAAALLASATAAAVPMEFLQQGRLLDANGDALTGSQDLDFTIYGSETGTDSLWTDSATLDLDAGFYSYYLGSNVVLDTDALSGGELWLSLSVDGTELDGRQKIVSVPYALWADTATNVSGGTVDASSISINGTELAGIAADGTIDADSLGGLAADSFLSSDSVIDADTLGGKAASDFLASGDAIDAATLNGKSDSDFLAATYTPPAQVVNDSGEALKTCAGSTTPGSTGWKIWTNTGLLTDVDISGCGFTEKPVISASIGGKRFHVSIRGAQALYDQTKDGFRIYITGDIFDPAVAETELWHVQWIAVGK